MMGLVSLSEEAERTELPLSFHTPQGKTMPGSSQQKGSIQETGSHQELDLSASWSLTSSAPGL